MYFIITKYHHSTLQSQIPLTTCPLNFQRCTDLTDIDALFLPSALSDHPWIFSVYHHFFRSPLPPSLIDRNLSPLFCNYSTISISITSHGGGWSIYFSAHAIAASDARLSMKKPAVRGRTEPL